MIICESCRRHYRADEAACPFCAAGSRRTRVGLLAAGLAGALAACASPPPAPVYGGPPEPAPVPAPQTKAAPSEAAPRSAESKSPESAAPKSTAPSSVPVRVPAYGAPPPPAAPDKKSTP